MTQAQDQSDWAVLMQDSLSGDADAYRRLLASLAPTLRAFVQRRGHAYGLERADAEDVVQETLLAIHLKRHTWDPSRPIAPWIVAITRNKMIDAQRRRRVRRDVPLEDVAPFLTAQPDDDPLIRRDLETMFEALGVRNRDLVQSISVEGRSIGETAKRLNMKEGAVRVALHRAIKAMATMYRSYES